MWSTGKRAFAKTVLSLLHACCMQPNDLQKLIERAWADPALLKDAATQQAVATTIAQLDDGMLRVASCQDGVWHIHAWVKQAILLYFKLAPMQEMSFGPHTYYDKIPLKTRLKEQGVRLVPPGAVRYGAFLEPGCVVMPGYVNIGAYVGAGSMVDTWATVGSCAQIGARVHLSGGVGIGGVLEPPQAAPVIIEDDAFVGSRCIVVEGVHIGKQAVLGAGVVLTATTPIIDVTQTQELVLKGRVPARSVVVPGVRPKAFAAGTYHLPCALIIGERSARTDTKTSLNDVLRDFNLAV